MSYLVFYKELTKGDYKIIPIRDQDKFLIMQWRNEQMDILRQQEALTEEMQSRYFEMVVNRERNMLHPNQILVSYLKNNRLIGYGGLVHINWIDRRGEVSFLLESKRNENSELLCREYSIFLSFIKILAFDKLHFNKITTEAFDIRPQIIQTLEENGFVLEGRLRDHNFIKGKFVDSIIHGCFSKNT